VCDTAVEATAAGLITGWWAAVWECFSSHPLWYLCCVGVLLFTSFGMYMFIDLPLPCGAVSSGQSLARHNETVTAASCDWWMVSHTLCMSIYVRTYVYTDLLIALQRSVTRTYFVTAQRNSNRGFMRLVDGKYHVCIYISAYLHVYRSTSCFAAQRGQDILWRGATKP